MDVTKTENGMQFPAQAYAYVPDAKSPATWKLRLWETPESKVTAAQVGRAVAALGKGFRGKTVQIPETDRAGVVAKVRAAWDSIHGGKAALPAALKEAATTELQQIADLVCDALGDKFQADAAVKGAYEPWGVEALFPERVIVYQDGRYWSFPYTLGDDNGVTLGAAQEVVENFTPVASSAVTEAAADPDAQLLEADENGKQWEVRIISAGASKNKWYYPDETLRQAAPLLEGVRVFIKGDEEHLAGKGKHPSNIVGWISAPRFVAGAKPDQGELRGKMNIAAGFSALRETLVDAWKRGKRNLVGLSIDALAKTEPVREGVRLVRSITSFKSVDLIVDPSAGGALVRLIEAAQEQDPMKEQMIAAIKAKKPGFDASTLTDAQILEAYNEVMKPVPANDRQDGPAMTRREFDEAMAHQRLLESAKARINRTTLPEPSKEQLIARFAKLQTFTEKDVDDEIKAERDHVVRIAESLGADAGKVRLAAGDIQVGDRSKQITHMLDAFFNPDGKDAEGKAYPRVTSIKECYIEMTGDRRVTGRMENVDRTRLAESTGSTEIREGLDTTAFSNVLGSSITRRMVADYNNVSEYDGWKQIVGTPVPLSDFRQQIRVRFGGYGDLPIVNQGGVYTALASPTDEAPTYTPAKRGGTEDITLEMIKNDDVGAVRRIPVRMSRSAKRTLAKFVFDMLRNPPVLYDGVAFFHATHGNLGSTAFSAAEYGVVRIAMAKQTELNSADRLGIYPSLIVYPLDLQETVWNAFQRNTNLDKTFIQQLNPTLIPVWYWTDTNDWVAMASPSDIPTIEIGFLDGQEEPQLFVQDMPNVGSMFSNDKLTYKMRHIYGGAPLDFRGAYKEVV